jgi:archaetidylserine synthase
MPNRITRVGEAAANRVGAAVHRVGDTVARLDENSGHPPGAPRRGRIRAYFDAAVRDEWDGLDRINRDLRLADLFTITNSLMGLGALLLATQGQIERAVQLVLVGVIMDGVDGAVARLGKGGGPLGGVLDTLADAVTFVTASAVITFFHLSDAGLTGWREHAAVLAQLAFYVVCGLLRLARFESLRDDGKRRYYFSGIPTPAAAIMLLSLVLVDVPAWVLLVVGAYVGVLMVSRVRFPKLRGWGAVTSLAIIVALLVTAGQATGAAQQGMAWAMLAFMGAYVVIGPFYVLARYGAPPAPVAPREE